MKREIKLLKETNLSSVVYTLLEAKAKGESVYCYFNGQRLDSDTISMDSAYMQVLGVTKGDYDKLRRKTFENNNTQEAKAKAIANIPYWIGKGQELIFPERYSKWEECVVSCASSSSLGLELDYALEIMTALKNGASLKEAREIFCKQGHYEKVRQILLSFSDRGPEFWEITAYKELSSEIQQRLEEKKQENIQLVLNSKKRKI